MDKLIIRCPKCQWQPHESDQWMCDCGHCWNTFDTGGRCPACGKLWEHTQCLSNTCLQFSPHLDWYKNLDDLTHEINEIIKAPAPF